MFIFGIYLPPYLARVISYLYNFLSGPVFISIPPGGTVSNGRAHPSPLLISQQQDQCSLLCIISLIVLSIFFITHIWYNFIFKISFTFYLSIYTYIYIFFRISNLDLYLENHRFCLLLCKQLNIESEHAHYVISSKALQLLLSFIYICDLIIL